MPDLTLDDAGLMDDEDFLSPVSKGGPAKASAAGKKNPPKTPALSKTPAPRRPKAASSSKKSVQKSSLKASALKPKKGGSQGAGASRESSAAGGAASRVDRTKTIEELALSYVKKKKLAKVADLETQLDAWKLAGAEHSWDSFLTADSTFEYDSLGLNDAVAHITLEMVEDLSVRLQEDAGDSHASNAGGALYQKAAETKAENIWSVFFGIVEDTGVKRIELFLPMLAQLMFDVGEEAPPDEDEEDGGGEDEEDGGGGKKKKIVQKKVGGYFYPLR